MLSRNDGFLRDMSESTGGCYAPFAAAHEILARITPKTRTEKHEQSVRLWDSLTILWFIVIVLTVEWVWRKWVGLV